MLASLWCLCGPVCSSLLALLLLRVLYLHDQSQRLYCTYWVRGIDWHVAVSGGLVRALLTLRAQWRVRSANKKVPCRVLVLGL